MTLDPPSITSVSNLIGNPTESAHWAMQVGFKSSYEPDYYPSGGGLFTPTAGFNPGGYANAQMTRLMRATYAADTPQPVAARFNAHQQYAVQQLPVLWAPTLDSMTVRGQQRHDEREQPVPGPADPGGSHRKTEGA